MVDYDKLVFRYFFLTISCMRLKFNEHKLRS
jgi:hypothetical protein